MEKRLIKKDALSGIAKKMTEDFMVWAPVKKRTMFLLPRWAIKTNRSFLI